MTVYVLVIVFAGGAALLAQSSAASLKTEKVAGKGRSNASPRWFFALLAGAVLTVVAALRWNVGTDYANYSHNYHSYYALPWSQFGVFGEPGIKVIAKAGRFIYDDYASMFALASIVTVGLTVRTIYKRSTMFALSIVLYVLTSSWQGSFNTVRQYLACAILFAGHKYILDRNFKKWILVVGLATLFHISAILMVLFYWVPHSRLRVWRTATLMLLAIVTASAYTQLGSVFGRIKQSDISTSSTFLEDVSPLRIAAAFAPVAFYVLFTLKQRLTAVDYFYVNVLFVNAAIFLASAGNAYLARLTIYTSVYATLAIPRMLNMEDRRFAAVSVLAVVSFFAVFWYIDTSSSATLVDFHWIGDR